MNRIESTERPSDERRLSQLLESVCCIAFSALGKADTKMWVVILRQQPYDECIEDLRKASAATKRKRLQPPESLAAPCFLKRAADQPWAVAAMQWRFESGL